MTDNKTFQIALLVSVLVHSIFFFTLPQIPFLPSKRSLGKIEISYYKVKKEIPEKKKISSRRKPIVKKLPKVTKEDLLKPPKDLAKETRKPKASKKSIVALEKVKNKKFETVVREEKNKAKKAAYINYYRAVREKIRKQADRNYPQSRDLGEGEVFLTFVIASNGELLQVKVVNRKSVKDPELRQVAIDSVRDASPFPAFPKGMSQYRITFTLIMSFEPEA